MKIMLTSFGVEHSLSSEAGQESMFHRMPPVSFGRISEAFMPDYELLLLCDRVIMDEASFDRLIRGSVAAYSRVAETFQALKSEGRIELKGFSSTLRPHTGLLGRMVDHDLKSLDQWVVPLRESLTLWRHFSKMSMEIMWEYSEQWTHQRSYRDVHSLTREFQEPPIHEVGGMLHSEKVRASYISMLVNEALESSKKRKLKEFRGALRDVLRAYLSYVDANLILSHQIDCGFHDWLDFTPFYAAKFLSVGHAKDPVREGRAQLEKLFTVPFPDLAISNASTLMKALNDKRLEDLRLLVAEAVAGNVEFDDEFAKSVLREVFHGSERAKKWRNVVGYATLPIGFIPWVGTAIQKAVEEGVGIPIERKFKQKHRWFYMLSDIAEAGRKTEQ
jgi:hypothetical protein